MGADYQGKFYIADVIRGQWSTFTRDEMILATARLDAARFHGQVRIYIEQEPGSGGIDSLRSTIQKLAGYPVFGHWRHTAHPPGWWRGMYPTRTRR
jgi:hypothetical protein